MKKILGITAILLALVAVAAAQTSVDTPLETSGEVTDSDYQYYLEKGNVAYPAQYTREKVDGEWSEKAIYENMSVDRFAAMKASDIGSEALESHLSEELDGSIERVSIGTTGHETHHFALQVTYIEPADRTDTEPRGDEDYISEPSFSYETLQSVTPEAVEVDVSFADRSQTVSVPVTTERTTVELDYAVEGNRDAGKASQEGGSNGSEWTLDVTKTGASCWSGNHSEQLRDISYSGEDSVDGERAITFIGTIETGTPCYEIAGTDVEKDGDVYTLDIVTNQSEGMCVQCVGAVTYEATFSADQDYRLKVLHDGEHVQDLDYPGYEPGDPSEPPKNFLDRLVDWLQGLF